MSLILPIQNRFDKSIPDNFGNCEYRSERQFLISIDSIIKQHNLEDPVISYFLDAASVDKYISVFGTGKSTRLSVLSHNLWVLGRIKVAQDKAKRQAA